MRRLIFIAIIILLSVSALAVDTPVMLWGNFNNASFNQTLTDSIYCNKNGINCNQTLTNQSTLDLINKQGFYNSTKINTTQLQEQTDGKLGILWSWFVSSWNNLMALVGWGGDLTGTGTSPQVAPNSTQLDISNITSVNTTTLGGDVTGTLNNAVVADNSHLLNYKNITDLAGNSSNQILAVIVTQNYYNDSNQQPDYSTSIYFLNITDGNSSVSQLINNTAGFIRNNSHVNFIVVNITNNLTVMSTQPEAFVVKQSDGSTIFRVDTKADLLFTGQFSPRSNATYSIGTASGSWYKNLFLSGNITASNLTGKLSCTEIQGTSSNLCTLVDTNTYNSTNDFVGVFLNKTTDTFTGLLTVVGNISAKNISGWMSCTNITGTDLAICSVQAQINSQNTTMTNFVVAKIDNESLQERSDNATQKTYIDEKDLGVNNSLKNYINAQGYVNSTDNYNLSQFEKGLDGKFQIIWQSFKTWVFELVTPQRYYNATFINTTSLVNQSGVLGISDSYINSQIANNTNHFIANGTDGNIVTLQWSVLKGGGTGTGKKSIYQNTTATDSFSWIELWGLDATRQGELTLGGKYIQFFTESSGTSVGNTRATIGENSGRGNLTIKGDIYAYSINTSIPESQISNYGANGSDDIFAVVTPLGYYNSTTTPTTLSGDVTGNMSLTVVGANSTLLDCANITGAVSNLCTLTASGGGVTNGSNVNFNIINASVWTNVTITENQITNYAANDTDDIRKSIQGQRYVNDTNGYNTTQFQQQIGNIFGISWSWLSGEFATVSYVNSQNTTTQNSYLNVILLNNQTQNLFQAQQNTTQAEHIEAELGNFSSYYRSGNVTWNAYVGDKYLAKTNFSGINNGTNANLTTLSVITINTSGNNSYHITSANNLIWGRYFSDNSLLAEIVNGGGEFQWKATTLNRIGFVGSSGFGLHTVNDNGDLIADKNLTISQYVFTNLSYTQGGCLTNGSHCEGSNLFMINQNTTQSFHIEEVEGNMSVYVRGDNATSNLFLTTQNNTVALFCSNRILINNQTVNLFGTQQNTTQFNDYITRIGNQSSYDRSNNGSLGGQGDITGFLSATIVIPNSTTLDVANITGQILGIVSLTSNGTVANAVGPFPVDFGGGIADEKTYLQQVTWNGTAFKVPVTGIYRLYASVVIDNSFALLNTMTLASLHFNANQSTIVGNSKIVKLNLSNSYDDSSLEWYGCFKQGTNFTFPANPTAGRITYESGSTFSVEYKGRCIT